MKICIAQIKPFKGEINQNVNLHKKGTIYKHRLHFLACNLNQNSD